MLALGLLSAEAFTPPTRLSQSPAISRRDLFVQGAGAALATVPLAAFADGANSKANVRCISAHQRAAHGVAQHAQPVQTASLQSVSAAHWLKQS